MQESKRGLTEKEVLQNREKYGENKISEYKKKSFLKCYISNLSDPIIKVLIAALFINIIFMFPNINWFESGGILCSIIISTLVSTASEYSSENTFEKLRQSSQNIMAIVKRADGVCEINAEEVVVGDILVINPGQSIASDGEMIDGEIYVDESALTGESKEVLKRRGDKVLKGSLALSGSGEMRSFYVGEGTYYGKVAKELRADLRPSPLKMRLTDLARTISKIGYILAFLIAVSYLFNVFIIDVGFDFSKTTLLIKDVKFLLSKLLVALTLAVSIVVVAVPEGLPMMITVVLSSNMKRMMKDNVLVRKMVGIETSGNINLLFTDKTGTLTEGKLRVKEFHSAFGEAYTSFNGLKKNEKFSKYLTLCGNFCNNATYNGGKAIGSDAMDRCLKEYFFKSSLRVRDIYKIPFDSTKKHSCAFVEFEGEKIMLFKGAPEKLIGGSKYFLNKDGEASELSSHSLKGLYDKLNDLSSKSYRVIALAMKRENSTELRDLVFISLVAIRDRVRKEVPKAINEVQSAGVGVVMITGDNPKTAEAIGRECGIITPYSQRQRVISGSVLEKMSDEEIRSILPSLAIVARALPSDKSRLVKIAQDMGYVVGMTGDGINDAPSLKRADVGFGMGSGTDVAKEACDIVISDNNFASIVKAILYGRTIFESIRKFIVFQLTMNFGAVGISLIGPFVGIDNPVTVTQMLWVNIIMDTLGALAFASEPYLKEYLLKPPKSLKEKIISRDMLVKIAFTSTYVLLLCLWFLKSEGVFMILTRCDERYLLSAFFAMFIFTGVFVCFTARTNRINILNNISKNKSFLSIMILIALMQMAFIYFGGDTFRAVPLKFEDLLRVIMISFTVVIFDFIRKLVSKGIKYKKTIKLKEKRNAIK